MTKTSYILPMSQCRRIIFIAYEGVELLDIAGPSSVFSSANTIAGKSLYKILLVTPDGEYVPTHSGLTLASEVLGNVRFTNLDTVLVVGAYKKNLTVAMRSEPILQALKIASNKAERFGSVCTGAFILASAGLLEGRRVTTHWAGRSLATISEGIKLDIDALYVRDGKLWTSAGVSAGIDMALAMIESDHGIHLKASIAKQLVVYSHRPGYQSQFSELLTAQLKANDRYGDLINWLSGRLDRATKVSEMADYLAMSERSFFRHFSETFNQTPSKFFEHLRLDASKDLLEAGQPINIVASKIGFQSETAFRTAFKAKFGLTPTLFIQMNSEKITKSTS